MKTVFFLSGILLMASSLPSCTSCTKTEDVACNNGSLLLYTAGFDSTDFDSAVTLRYKQDNAFDSLIDTVATTYQASSAADTGYLSQQDPAFAIKTHITAQAGLNPGFDYKIILPAIGKTYLLTNIVQTGTTHHVFSASRGISDPNGSLQCFNNVVSCQINGVTYASTQQLEFSTARLFLTK